MAEMEREDDDDAALLNRLARAKGGESGQKGNETGFELQFGDQDDNEEDEEEEEKQMLHELEDQILDIEPDFGVVLYQPEGQRVPTAEDYQIRLWVDRYRGPELLFQPSIIGLDCTGFAEVAEHMLNSLTPEQRRSVLSNVHV